MMNISFENINEMKASTTFQESCFHHYNFPFKNYYFHIKNFLLIKN